MFIAVISFITVFYSCAGKPAILFFAEEYWWDILVARENFEARLREAAAQYGYECTILVGELHKNYADILRNEASRRPYEKIIVSPLMAVDVVRMASKYPQTQFLVLGAPYMDIPFSENVIPVRRKDSDGYREAGKAAGYLLAETEGDSFGRRVGMIVEEKSMAEQDVITEFEQGFSEYAQPSMLAKEVIAQANDKVRAVQAVEDLASREVRVFFVKASTLTIACVEKIIAVDGYFIIEDFPSFNLNSDRLIGSIQDDPVETIAGALLELQQPQNMAEEIEIQSVHYRFIPGPVYVKAQETGR